MTFKGKKQKLIDSKQKSGHIGNKNNTKFHRIIVSQFSIRGQVRKDRITQVQQKITSFFLPTSKSGSQPHFPLNKNSFKIGNNGKFQSHISGKAASMAKHSNVKN